MTLGEKIRQAREQLGWSGNELANRSGLPQPTIHRVETKPDAEPSVFTVAAIAKALGTSIDELVGEVTITLNPTTKAAKTDDRVEKLEAQVELLMKKLSDGSPPQPPSKKRGQK